MLLLKTFWRAALAATALAPSPILAADKDNPPGQSTFVSPGGDVGFAFTVPDNDNSDIFFSLRVPTENSWGGVGLGSDDMKGALFLILYRNERGDNVTLSPRVAYGNYEPQLYPEVEMEVLNGTGVVDGYMVFNAKCSKHCRSWPAGGSNGGYIDVSSPNQKAVYAVGPRESFGSDNPGAGIKFHRDPGVPVLTKDSVNEGTTLDYRETGRSDVKAALHATLMVFCIVAMFPFGVVVLRLGRWARWHGLNQTVAMAGVLAGLGLGVAASFNYQRSRGFRSYHQILGFIIVAFILVQFSLGFLHHTQYRKTQAPTKYGRVHLWLGRLIIFLGVLNAFFGFAFALDRKYGLVLAGLIIFGALATLFVVIWRQRLTKQQRFQPVGGPLNGTNTGYQPQPWREDHHQASGSNYPSDPPPGYEPPSQQIGLHPVSSSSSTPWRSSDAKEYEDDAALGSAQRPREFT
ncbi:hypothetical protein TOPH_05675 [Tolypocladium ophioglossoides CBS 100239]|uniref:Cytochrome b561 domain-containing protein n=1 Tax=Tolypocladium ophioglossoides (strain CBS 100239) TaxID=1163406 RepID=A0A0L0N6B9_TOLOC|nr:hypothetical protein TOPH_05675 [Tolypocladium ophioglossoides CBS 100239]